MTILVLTNQVKGLLLKSLPPPFLPHPDEDFDYGQFLADQIIVMLDEWSTAILLTEAPEELLQTILDDLSDPEDQKN